LSTILTRVLLAVDTATPQRGSMEAVAGLGIATRIILSATFFEDTALLESAGLSCAREIAGGNLPPRLLNKNLLEQQLRQRAERLRREVGNLAKSLGAEHEVHFSHGPSLRELLKQASEHDVLVLGRPGSIAGLPVWMGEPLERLLISGPPTIVLVQDRWSKGSGILTILDHCAGREQTMATSARIARAASLPLLVVRQAPQQSSREGEDQRYATSGDEAIPVLTDLEIIRLIRRQRIRSVVLPAAMARAAPALIPTILRRCQCSIVVCS